MKVAPLHTAAFELCRAIQQQFDPLRPQGPMRERIQLGALALLDHVTLAVLDRDRHASLRSADAELQTLRVHFELAYELGLLNEDEIGGLADACDRIGRQIGGWLRAMQVKRSPLGSTES